MRTRDAPLAGGDRRLSLEWFVGWVATTTVPYIVFVQPDGSRETHEGEPGRSIMDCAVDNGVPGIRAQCGGGCTCSTCHGFVDEAWFDRAGAPVDDEADILDFVPGRRVTSRLTCQIVIRDDLDGIVIHVPPPEQASCVDPLVE